MTSNQDWEFAGMTRESGILDRPVSDGSWPAPNVVRLDKSHQYLLWGERHKERPWVRSRLPGPGMLESFVGLASASDEEIHEYARNWGVLMLCEHGLRYGLVRRPECDTCQEKLSSRDLTDLNRSVFKERISDWRMFSEHFGIMLSVASYLHETELAGKKNLQRLFDIQPETEKAVASLSQIEGSKYLQQRLIVVVVERLSERADLQMLFSWNPYEKPSLNIGGSLFGALVLQLILVISRIDSFALCSACGIPFLPKRTPNPNRRRYCPGCGVKAAWKDAKRDERKKTIG